MGTTVSYSKELSRYIAFTMLRGYDEVPGLEVAWCMSLLWHFLSFRASTRRPSSLASILSALSHFGTDAGYLLATSKYDSDSLTYRRIVRMKKELTLRHRAKFGGLVAGYGPNRCTPLGCAMVSLLFSAFGVVDKASFQTCPRAVRHNLWCNAMQHTRGMRFGHFIYRSYVMDSFDIDARDGTARLVTDWHRYSGKSRYCLKFAVFPKWSCMLYDLRAPDGTIVDSVSAATVSS